MASIRLFGRGRNAAAPATPGVGAAQIAEVLDGLESAALSTTWRCRHGAGLSLGEGAVDFAARRSRASVIRGKSTFDYVRAGASVYRAAVPVDLEVDVDAEPDEDDGDEDKAEDAERAWQSFSEHDACGVHAYAEPAVLAAGVRAVGSVQPRAAEEFDGELLAAYSVTLKPKPADPDKLLARLARQLRDHGANTVIVTAFADESGWDEESDEPVEDTDGAGAKRIVRLRIELPHWTPADDPTADHAVSVDLFELGEPVEIEVPDADAATRRTSRSCADLGLF
jgi:hypothetical protein